MKKTIFIQVISYALLICGIAIAIICVNIYNRFKKVNIKTHDQGTTIVYIPSGSELKDILEILDSTLIIKNLNHLRWVAEFKNFPSHIHPGKYAVPNKINNNKLINILRSGSQVPIQITFNNIRTLKELSEVLSPQIEPTDSAILSAFESEELINELGLSKETFPSIFLPNTYEVYWSITPEQLVMRMYKEYEKFWTDDRKIKAARLGMTTFEVTTLSTIVDEETYYNSEKPIVAGLYLNRLKKGIPLQADPTIKFVIGDFTVKRILNRHLKIESPYNTYKVKGLPPGPITLPSIKGIDAVLNRNENNYIYMCAKDDFSGYHNFATTLKQHNENARKYRQALNRNKIFK